MFISFDHLLKLCYIGTFIWKGPPQALEHVLLHVPACTH